jgi:hypothetical protein
MKSIYVCSNNRCLALFTELGPADDEPFPCEDCGQALLLVKEVGDEGHITIADINNALREKYPPTLEE